MHFRRLACLLLGAWLGGSLFMAAVATQNFRSVDRLLDRPAPAAAQEIKAMGQPFARSFLRYQVSEQNRWYFEAWGNFQIGLGLLLFFLLLFGSTETKFSLLLSLLMAAIAVVERFPLTTMLTSLGRVLDFVPASVHAPERYRFVVLHSAYLGMEGMKVLLGLVLAGKLVIRSRRRSAQAGWEVDVVDKPYYRHIDR